MVYIQRDTLIDNVGPTILLLEIYKASFSDEIHY